MMRTSGVLLVLTLLVPGAARAGEMPAPPRSFEQTMADIHLLQQFRHLRVTGPQLRELRKAWQEVEGERRKLRETRETPEIRAAAAAVRQALLENRPNDELEPLFERLEMLRHRDGEEEEPEARLESAARSAAASFMGRLQASQIARLVGDEEEEGGPAHEILHQARARRGEAEERKAFIPAFSLRMSQRLTRDVARAGKARAELEAFLTRALALSDPEFEKQEAALRAEVEQIVNRAVGSPIGVLQWQAEQRLTHLLLHPRLGPMLDERLRREQPN